MTTPRVSIILVNWNNFADTAECLESLGNITYPNYDIVVVDNGSEGDDAVLLRERFGESIRLMENESNLGFAGGCNTGIRYALEQGADYVVLLNNDTVVNPDFLDRIVEAVAADSGTGIAGGKIYCYEAPEVIWSAGGVIDRRRGQALMRGSGELDRGQYDSRCDIDWICACFMLVSRGVLETVGLLDERFFFSWEDTDLCFRAARGGYRVLYVPESRIWHKAWGDPKKERLKGYPLYYATRGYLIFIDKHYTGLRLAVSWLYFALMMPRIIWDYSRLTGQRKGPLYALRAVVDFLRMKCGCRLPCL